MGVDSNEINLKKILEGMASKAKISEVYLLDIKDMLQGLARWWS